MQHTTGTFAGHGGVALACQRWAPDGPTARATLAIVHGFGEHSGRYATLVQALVGQGYAIHAFDLRGHGRSPGRRGHVDAWDEFRADVRAFLAVIAGEEPPRPVTLLGHSMGGLIVLDYALHHPDGLSGVVASAPALGQVGVSPARMRLARLVSRVFPTFAQQAGLDVAALSRDPRVVSAYRDDPLVHGTGTARLAVEMAATSAWVQAQAAELRVPLLILHGGADRIVPPESSRLFYERVTLDDKERHEYPGVYHEPHNDLEAACVLRDLCVWLDRHTRAS